MKEVVHVPTRELAEEVLRVAKENGLMKAVDIRCWEYHKTETYFRPHEYGGFSNLSFAERNGYKIITAEEFLDRYKPKFRPIAMRCTQEQFDAVRSKLVGLKVRMLSTFDNCPYLINNLGGAKGVITNVPDLDKSGHNREVVEEWNEKVFLGRCGIQVKDEVNELEQLRKENAELKQQLKAIEGQPKVGDVCLFWDGPQGTFITSILTDINYKSKYTYTCDYSSYINCIKATPENIQAKIKELRNE